MFKTSKTVAPNSCGYVAHVVTHYALRNYILYELRAGKIGHPMGTRPDFVKRRHTLPAERLLGLVT